MVLNNKLSPLGLGTSRIASLGSKITQTEANLLFKLALDYGVKTIDTSDTYGSGDSERMIGNAIHSHRKDFFIITKAGFPYFSTYGFLSPINQIGKKVIQKISPQKNFSKKYLLKSLHKSLKRLQTETVDCFMLHEPVHNELIKYDDCWEALVQIKKTGMAQNIGISTNDTKALELAMSNVTIDMLQTSMPYTASGTLSVFDLGRSNNIPVIVNQVLSPVQKLFSNGVFMDLLKKHKINESELAPILIAYALNFKKAACVLIGTKSPTHLKSNAGFSEFNSNMDIIFAEISKILL